MGRTTPDLTAPPKDARSFDKWFYALPRKQQDKLRDNGVLPYREMRKAPDQVFPVLADHKAWATFDGKERTEQDSFISRDHVGRMLKGFIDALSMTDDMRFRRHVELVRWALGLPGAMSSRQIGKLYGLSHEMIRIKAKAIRSAVAVDALTGFCGHVVDGQLQNPPTRESSKRGG